jgi:stage II sporulation protein GA (sporulation sigma-E factor processing peptidase)
MRWYQNNAPVTYEVDLVLDGRSISTRGLMDTGNCLHDPIYNRPVMVLENSLMEGLLKPEFAKDLEEAKHYLEGNELDTSQWNIGTESILRLRFIPYRSVGKSGMLLGIKLDKVLIHTGKETICNEKVTAAFCDNRLSSKEEYHVILHKELL